MSDEVDNHLNEVALKQLTWKPSVMREVACTIVNRAVLAFEFWPDEVDLAVPEASVNCVGSAYRLLAKAGIIEKTGKYQPSKRPSSAGRTVFRYRLLSQGLARTFLKRNQPQPIEQPSLLL